MQKELLHTIYFISDSFSLQLEKFMNHKLKPFFGWAKKKTLQEGIKVMNFIMKLPANHFSNQY